MRLRSPSIASENATGSAESSDADATNASRSVTHSRMVGPTRVSSEMLAPWSNGDRRSSGRPRSAGSGALRAPTPHKIGWGYRSQRGMPERPHERPTAILTTRFESAPGPRDAARVVAESRAPRNNMPVSDGTEQKSTPVWAVKKI